MASTGDTWRLGHRPALDGLRGVAVLLVVLAHTFPTRFVGAGPAGVSVFFVLSGFLITTLLLEERERSGRTRLVGFYRRRALRLLPALVVFLVVMLALGPMFATRAHAVAVALYVANWATVAGADFGGMVHTWSLSVEEQFYIAYPLLVIAVMRRSSKRLLLCITAIGALASFSERVWLWCAGFPVGRVYFATDTNIGALLLGCSVGIAMTMRKPSPCRPRLAAVALMVVALSAFASEGMQARVLVPIAASLLGAVVIFAATSGTYFGALTSRPLTFIGQRSYALYLWHFPLVATIASRLPLPWFTSVAICLAATGLLTCLSWRYVEEPFLRKRVSSTSRPRVASRPAETVAAGRAA